MTTVVWLSKALRLDDNPALYEAAKGDTIIAPVVCLDPREVNESRLSANRAHFLLKSIESFKAELQSVGGDLIVCVGKAEAVIPELVSSLNATTIYCDVDLEPQVLQRQHKALRELADKGITVRVFESCCLLDHKKFLSLNRDARHPLTYESFITQVGDKDIIGPVLAPRRLSTIRPPSAYDRAVPTLGELGFKKDATYTITRPGIVAATDALNNFLNGQKILTFNKPASSPVTLQPSTSGLSSYISVGSLSARRVHAEVLEALRSISELGWLEYARTSTSFLAQLMWREFFYFVGRRVPNFGVAEGNPICRPIPWRSTRSGNRTEREEARRRLDQWERGRTGYPWVDAFLRQMRLEGWTHHIGRHVISCFLTRGQLYISWEEGSALFRKYFLDYDYFVNAGNWLWISASAFSSAFYRVYSPVQMALSYTGAETFVQRYVSEVRRAPVKYLFEPWKMSKEEQLASGCRIAVDGDYPPPMMDADAAAAENVTRLKLLWPKISSGSSQDICQINDSANLPGGVRIGADGTVEGDAPGVVGKPSYRHHIHKESWESCMAEALRLYEAAESSIAKAMAKSERERESKDTCLRDGMRELSTDTTVSFTASDVLYCRACDKFERAAFLIGMSINLESRNLMTSELQLTDIDKLNFVLKWGHCIFGRSMWLIASSATLEAMQLQGVAEDEIQELADSCLGCFLMDDEREVKSPTAEQRRQVAERLLDQCIAKFEMVQKESIRMSSIRPLSETRNCYSDASLSLAEALLQRAKLRLTRVETRHSVEELLVARNALASATDGRSISRLDDTRYGDLHMGKAIASALLLRFVNAMGGRMGDLDGEELEADCLQSLNVAAEYGSLSCEDLLEDDDFSSVNDTTWFVDLLNSLPSRK